MKAHYWFILFLWVAVRMEAGGKMAVSSSATEILLPFPSHDVELASSWVKQRENLNTAFLKSLEPDRLLHNFRVNAGLAFRGKALGRLGVARRRVAGTFRGTLSFGCISFGGEI